MPLPLFKKVKYLIFKEQNSKISYLYLSIGYSNPTQWKQIFTDVS